jgi:ATP-dependent helicase/nuclease subunit A
MEEVLTNHQAEALDINNHLALTANAGSGKTFVLKKRFVEILLQKNVSIRNIAAITFTEKAASDLYKKIAEEIESRIQSETNEDIIKKLERLRRQLVSANISTIHAFCINILREFPVEAGLDANFIPIDTNLANELIELSVDEVIRSSFNDLKLEDDLKNLIRIFGSKSLFANQLIELIKNRKNVQTLKEEIYNKIVEQIADHFYSAAIDYFEKIFLPDKGKIIKQFQNIIAELKNIDKKKDLADEVDKILNKLKNEDRVLETISLFNEVVDKCFTRQGKFSKRILPKDFYEKYESELEEISNYVAEIIRFQITENHREIELELARTGKNMIKFFELAVKLYDQKKREDSYLDFEDILLFTKNILNNEFVKESLSEKFKYIMIDEYQDTNEIQYKIFLPILEDLKKGNFFVVGDEKQSIYMFRDAELEVYNKTKNDIIESQTSGKALSLPDSFRMSPHLCAFINELFGKLFREQNNLFGEVSYTELVCAREYNSVNNQVSPAEFNGEVEILLPSDYESNEFTEPLLIAKRIIKLINEKSLDFKDIAILCRKRKHFLELEKEFVRYKIPYSILGGKGFYQRQSIYDVYNYFSFLMDKNNGPALVGVLRSPFFNVSDSKIFEISLIDKPTYWKKVKAFAEKDDEIKKAFSILVKNLELAGSSSASDMLREILKESKFLSVLSSKPNGEQEIANINKLISLTVKFSEERFKNLYDYVDFLKKSIQKIEDESQAETSDESNSVSIITIHQSKGLEFKAVFLYKCDEKPALSSIKKKSIYADKRFGLLTKVPLNSNYFNDYYSAPILSVYDYINKRKQLAEFKRLFYVAATRAKDYLFVSSSGKILETDDNSFIGLIKDAFNNGLTGKELKVNNHLKFISKNNNEFKNFSKDVKFEIPIIREMDDISFVRKIKDADNFKHKFLVDELKGNIKGEIISATKIAVYSQCPLKYHLIYDLGFSKILNRYKNYQKIASDLIDNFEFTEKENLLSFKDLHEENISLANYSAVKGRVIHKILQNEIEIRNIENFIDSNLELSNKNFQFEKEYSSELKNEIIKEISIFYSSNIYKELKNFKVYKNELEVYSGQKDYFLYGIIDKAVFENKHINIYDYKTDNIEENKIDERAKTYFTQLKFYAYILSGLFPDVELFNLRIIFIKYPEKVIELELDKKNVHHFGVKIDQIVAEIRNSNLSTGQVNFKQNLNHCSQCLFAVKDKCIKTN